MGDAPSMLDGLLMFISWQIRTQNMDGGMGGSPMTLETSKFEHITFERFHWPFDVYINVNRLPPLK